MADVQGQTTDRLVETLETDKEVLYRGFMSISTPDTGPGGVYAPYYGAQGFKDVTFLNFTTLIPEIEVYEQTSATSYRKCPYADMDTGTGLVQREVRVEIQEGSTKTSGFAVYVTILVLNDGADVSPKRFFYTLKNKLAADASLELFEDNGSFS